jgi:putative ABC transport system substrate-binding protein
VSDTVAAPIFTATTAADGRKEYGLFGLMAAAARGELIDLPGMAAHQRAPVVTVLAVLMHVLARYTSHNDRLPALAVDLVRRPLTAIVTSTTPSALAVKAATTALPIIFFIAGDPVALGLVASLNRPGHNLTGITTLTVEVASKWLQLLYELVPTAKSFALLVNPTSSALAEVQSRDLQAAARILGLDVQVLHAATDRDLDSTFSTLAQLRVGGLVISSDSFFFTRSQQLPALAARHKVPAIFGFREFTSAGGLMSYGGSVTDAHRLLGVYTGRVLKGERPAD